MLFNQAHRVSPATHGRRTCGAQPIGVYRLFWQHSPFTGHRSLGPDMQSIQDCFSCLLAGKSFTVNVPKRLQDTLSSSGLLNCQLPLITLNSWSRIETRDCWCIRAFNLRGTEAASELRSASFLDIHCWCSLLFCNCSKVMNAPKWILHTDARTYKAAYNPIRNAPVAGRLERPLRVRQGRIPCRLPAFYVQRLAALWRPWTRH